ncbi:MAG TPA: hypothetical protein VIQ30_08975 [Pseudonocardia sp.]|jgi:hypothetical protein
MNHRTSKHSTARRSAARHSLPKNTAAKVPPAKVPPAKVAPSHEVTRPQSRLTRRELLAAVGAGGVIAVSATVVRIRATDPAITSPVNAAGMSYPKDLPPVVTAPELPEPLPQADLPPRADAVAADRGPSRLVMIIRHGEKPAKGTDKDDTDGSDGPLGWDPLGKPDKHSLTTRGWTRATGIAGLFAPKHSTLRSGLARPKLIYAAAANEDGDGTRTRETVKMLAQRLGVPVNTSFGKGDEAALAHHAAGQQVPVLICWQHGEIPAIAAAFGPSPRPPAEWPDDRFDMVWTLTPVRSSWKFDQVPQMVLNGDSQQSFR